MEIHGSGQWFIPSGCAPPEIGESPKKKSGRYYGTFANFPRVLGGILWSLIYNNEYPPGKSGKLRV